MVQIVAHQPPPGAEVRGLDLAVLPDEDVLSAILDAWAEHLVLVFRAQHLDDEQLLAFARCFGELDSPGPNPYGGPIHPRHPELNVISNIVERGRPIGNLGAGEAVWHQDLTYREQPPAGAVLYAVELPGKGGNTEFADLRQAFDHLPDCLRASVQDLDAVHDAAHNSAGTLRQGYREVTDVRQTPGARHPLVRLEPRTGRRSLFLGRRPHSYVPGLTVRESESLLDRLWAHATRRDWVYTHVWRPGDVLMWNNLSVLHRRDAFDPNARRRLHRAQFRSNPASSGEEAVGSGRSSREEGEGDFRSARAVVRGHRP